VAVHDGNGWVQCRCGRRHWGLHGAAGLVVVVRGDSSRVLLQLRAEWTHQGGTWGLPGGARDSHEDAVEAALREAREEVGLAAADVEVFAQHPGVDHEDWTYTYVLAVAGSGADDAWRPPVAVRTTESDELRWVDLDDVTALQLHPAFGAAWPDLRSAVEEGLLRAQGR
jgi:8-oxo-dGTP diphosphatase